MELKFEKSAMKNEPIPKNLSQAEQKAYINLRSLYAQYRAKLITRETASADKEQIIRALTTERSKETALDRENETLRLRIEQVSETYKADPTITNADKLYAAFYNLADDWRK